MNLRGIEDLSFQARLHNLEFHAAGQEQKPEASAVTPEQEKAMEEHLRMRQQEKMMGSANGR